MEGILAKAIPDLLASKDLHINKKTLKEYVFVKVASPVTLRNSLMKNTV